MGTININVASVDYPLDTPEYGYETIIGTALIHTEKLPRGFGIWDNGVANVNRILKTTWLLNATNTNTLLAIFNDMNKGRGVSVTLKLGNNSGLYPFGPDHGDSGNFGCRMISIEAKPVLEEPWQYFRTEIAFVEESKPTYSLPAEVSEGDLQIGTITNLRYPPNMPESHTRFGFSTQLTYSGLPYTISKFPSVNSHYTKLGMVCNQSKAAALINHLLATVRNNNVTIISQAGNYLFGRLELESGTYVCQWLDAVLKIKHVNYDNFNFDLNFCGEETS